MGLITDTQAKRLAEDPYADVLQPVFKDLDGRVSMETVKKMLGIQTPRMKNTDAQRIKRAMAEIGWGYGIYQFNDSTSGKRCGRRGFKTKDGRAETEFEVEFRESGEPKLVRRSEKANGERTPF